MNDILLTISTFEDIITETQILTQRQDNRILDFSVRLKLTDNSILERLKYLSSILINENILFNGWMKITL